MQLFNSHSPVISINKPSVSDRADRQIRDRHPLANSSINMFCTLSSVTDLLPSAFLSTTAHFSDCCFLVSLLPPFQLSLYLLSFLYYIFVFVFFKKNRCCLRYKLCYTNQIKQEKNRSTSVFCYRATLSCKSINTP